MKGANIWRMIRLFLMFFMFAHWVGCFWYFIAEYSHKMEVKYYFLNLTFTL